MSSIGEAGAFADTGYTFTGYTLPDLIGGAGQSTGGFLDGLTDRAFRALDYVIESNWGQVATAQPIYLTDPYSYTPQASQPVPPAAVADAPASTSLMDNKLLLVAGGLAVVGAVLYLKG